MGGWKGRHTGQCVSEAPAVLECVRTFRHAAVGPSGEPVLVGAPARVTCLKPTSKVEQNDTKELQACWSLGVYMQDLVLRT